MDNVQHDVGDLGGWSLQITAEVDVRIQERVSTRKDKKQHKANKKSRRGKS